ncbi:MAG: phosphotransferase family protein [Sphingomonas sp.]
MIVDDAERDARLRCWIETIGGGRITRVARVGGGAYRASARIAIERPDGRDGTLFVKVQTGPASITPFDLEREHGVLAAVAGRCRAPRPLGHDAGLDVMATEWLPGRCDHAGRTSPARRRTILRSLAATLADVHRIDPADLRLGHLPAGLTRAEAIAHDLDTWTGLLLGLEVHPDPVTRFAMAWCRRRCPSDPRPATLVHGDAGPGNFLFAGAGVTGLVDWELAHVGHPLEDLGGVLARSLMQPMADAGTLLALYAEATEADWSRADLAYCTILTMTRFALLIDLLLAQGAAELDLPLTSSYHRLALVSLLRLVAGAEAITLDERVPERGRRPAITAELTYLRRLLGTVARQAAAGEYARGRLEGAIGLLGYVEAAGVAPDVAPQADVQPGIDADTALVASGGEPLRRRLQALMSEALYREWLMRDMLGPFYGRRLAF